MRVLSAPAARFNRFAPLSVVKGTPNEPAPEEEEMTTKNLPSHTVFHVRDRGADKKAHWTEVGVAFTNKDGSLSVKLNCVPVDGQLQVRAYKPREENTEAPR
jgi:hypothetical protein